MSSNALIEDIRLGKIDINNQELFLSALIKGLMLDLNNMVKIRKISVPHIIIHTGSDALYLEYKGYDQSIEPNNTSNEDYIYNIIPRCIVKPQAIDLISDQITNPYSYGNFQFESPEGIEMLSAEFRRMPIKLTLDLNYYVDSYVDMLSLIQQMLTKLSFIRTYNITYMGQMITCSYKMPESFSDDHMVEMDGQTTDHKYHSMNINIEVETNLPVYIPETVISNDKYIERISSNIITQSDISLK